jgi:hypothetical protein
MSTPVEPVTSQHPEEARATADRWERLGEWVRHHDESWIFVAIYIGLAVGLSVFVSLFWLVVVGAFHLTLELMRQSWYRETWTSTVLHAWWEIKMDVGLILLALTLVLYLEVVLGLLGLQSAARAAAATRAAHAGARGASRAAQAGSRAAQAGSRAAQASSRAAQAGTRAGATGSAIEQWVRGFLLAVDEMARVVYATLVARKQKPVTVDGTAASEVAVDPRRLDEAAGAPEAVGGRTVASEPVATIAASAPGPGWRGRWGMADHLGIAMVAAGLVLLLLAPYITPHEWGTVVATLIDELRPLGSLGAGP